MKQGNVKALAQCLAEQQWMLTQLVTRLVELRVLQPGEMKIRFDRPSDEREEFVRDFLNHLESIGLETGPSS